MEMLLKIQKWGDTHHPAWIDFFRIALGVVLFWKGVQFATHLSAFTELMLQTSIGQSLGISVLAHLVIVIHLIGGFMIAIGTHTRIACLLQIPILLIAIFYVDLPAKIAGVYSELWLSISVMIALLFFMVEGNGPLSVEHDGAEETKRK